MVTEVRPIAIERAINWEFVIGFGLIGLMIFAHLALCWKFKRYGTRGGRAAPRGTHPISFWCFMALESVLLLIVWGGVAYYLWIGGGPSPIGNGVPQDWRP